MTDDADCEDERQIELDSISAIFPEIVLDAKNPFTASIDLPVNPSTPVPVTFTESSDGALIAESASSITVRHEDETQNLSHLPSLHLDIILPEGYPTTKGPSFQLSTFPPWLSKGIIKRLQEDGHRLWEEFGHAQVVYAYIDHIQQAAEDAFGALNGGAYLEVSHDHKISLLDYDIKAKRTAFEKETFNCGICLDPKKGSVCHRMLDCGHVFCCACLRDFYNNAITEGDLVSIKCLAPDCAKKRAESASQSKKHRKPKTHISPNELLQIPIDHEMVKRYVTLKHKAELESDKNTIYCPRKWCQGAARSKRHRKPTQDLRSIEISDDETDDETLSQKGYKSRDELLAICEDCSFAFCSRCYQGWHGEFTLCIPRTTTGELTEEDKASMEYLKLHTTPCPTCAAPAQKTHGCNHMICFRCNTHFCYLCSAWLAPENPYKHFNVQTTGCFMRLWELEEGDGDDVGIGFAGGRQALGGEEPMPHAEEEEDDGANIGIILHDDAFELPQNPNPNMHIEAVPNVQLPAAVVEQPAFAREGPLVLRIAAPLPVPVPPPAPEPPAPAQRRGAAARRAREFNGVQRGGRQPQPVVGLRRADGRGAQAQGMIQQINAQQAAQREWVQHFVHMALNDEEDQVEWDSDDDEDREGHWDIPMVNFE